jgi:hypothetical protein
MNERCWYTIELVHYLAQRKLPQAKLTITRELASIAFWTVHLLQMVIKRIALRVNFLAITLFREATANGVVLGNGVLSTFMSRNIAGRRALQLTVPYRIHTRQKRTPYSCFEESRCAAQVWLLSQQYRCCRRPGSFDDEMYHTSAL